MYNLGAERNKTVAEIIIEGQMRKGTEQLSYVSKNFLTLLCMTGGRWGGHTEKK